MNEATSSPPKLVEGKYVLLAVFALSAAAAGGGWWYQQRLQRRPLELWGHEAAQLMLSADDVELCRLEPASHDMPSTAIVTDGRTFQPLDCKNARGMRGILHLRHSLLSDYSFDWTDAASSEHDWRYALHFRHGDKSAKLFISADFRYVLLVETGAKACIKPIARGIEDVIGEQWTTAGRSR